MQVLDRYMKAVNDIELTAVTDSYHFPHIRIVNNQVVIWESPLDAMPMLSLPLHQQKQAMREALGPDWDYTDWEYRKLLSLGKNKAHIDTVLVRYDTQGQIISRFESLYILTLESGKWAIKGRSSFAPR